MFSKIILRKGPSIDLPGRPGIFLAVDVNHPLNVGTDESLNVTNDDDDDFFSVEPPQQIFAPTIGLDEGEIAFSTDLSGLYIGSNPQEGLPQNSRVAFPYQNVEIINESSSRAFGAMHGARLREGTGTDYYSSPLSVTSAWTPLLIDGTTAFAFTNSVSAFLDYTLTDQAGHRVRQGRQQIFCSGSYSDFSDEADMIRLDEQTYDPSIALMGVAFRAVTASGQTTIQYRNNTTGILSMRWKFTRPF